MIPPFDKGSATGVQWAIDFVIKNSEISSRIRQFVITTPMRTLRQNISGNDVVFLQALLREAGFNAPENGEFDAETVAAIKSFQKKNFLDDDAIAGKDTWKKLLEKGYTFFPKSTKLFLSESEFINELHYKNQIILHHTAGGPRPDFTIGWWEQDKQRVGTAFVIGRKAGNGQNKFDGAIYRAFPEFLWAYHLGLSGKNSTISADLRSSLNKTSIGIEICSYGPLLKQVDGTFKTVVNNKVIPKENVTDLGSDWRGYRYFEKYSEKQLEACKKLIMALAYFFDIPIDDIQYDSKWFDIRKEALNATPGIWTHVNYRKDKTDCFPQSELIAMLNSLHDEFKDFKPEMNEFESFSEVDIRSIPVEEVDHYSYDLGDDEDL